MILLDLACVCKKVDRKRRWLTMVSLGHIFQEATSNGIPKESNTRKVEGRRSTRDARSNRSWGTRTKAIMAEGVATLYNRHMVYGMELWNGHRFSSLKRQSSFPVDAETMLRPSTSCSALLNTTVVTVVKGIVWVILGKIQCRPEGSINKSLQRLRSVHDSQETIRLKYGFLFDANNSPGPHSYSRLLSG